MKAIHALGLLALLIGATFAEPLSTAELEPDTGDQLNLLMYDFEQPITGDEDPRLLAATVSKVLELARKQFAQRPRSDVTCLGIGYAGADPSAALLKLTRQSMPKVRPVSDCARRETMTTRISDRPDSLLRLDSIERRGRDFAANLRLAVPGIEVGRRMALRGRAHGRTVGHRQLSVDVDPVNRAPGRVVPAWTTEARRA